MMRYEDAIQLWGARRLANITYGSHRWSCEGSSVDEGTINVRFDFDEGYACCGGSDPNCYCSFAESPRADVIISGACSTCRRAVEETISAQDFDFVKILREIVDAGEGVITE